MEKGWLWQQLWNCVSLLVDGEEIMILYASKLRQLKLGLALSRLAVWLGGKKNAQRSSRPARYKCI